MLDLIKVKQAKMHELVENYRSKRNLVEFCNQFVSRIPHRLKRTPIQAHAQDNGIIKLIRYRSKNLIVPLVRDILRSEHTGMTCVLTTKNEEALEITGLLLQNGLQAKLISSNDNFNLYNLAEIRFFLDRLNSRLDTRLDTQSDTRLDSRLNPEETTYTISDDIWAQARRDLKEEFSGKANLELCLKLIKDFELVNPDHKYRSDLKIFIRESKLEDFVSGDNETILVSTIHKAKGREFDNVYLLLNNFYPTSDEKLRQLYVGLTRAKTCLTVHYNGNYLQDIHADDLLKVDDPRDYPPSAQLAMQLSHKDVWLGYFADDRCQGLIANLKGGDELKFDAGGCRDSQGRLVLKFCKEMSKRIEAQRERNYLPKIAKVRFIVYWRKEDSETEIRIILPELYFERI